MSSSRGARTAMLVRAVLALGVILLIATSSEAFSVAQPALRVLWPTSAAFAAEVGGISFSESVNEQARPINTAVDFPGSTTRLWVSFNYYEFKPGNRVTYMIRANGDVWQTGDVDCCVGSEGRYAFPIERERDRVFGGAGFEVTILIGGVEASRGNFQVRGTRGFDNDNSCDPDATHRGNLSNGANKDC